MSRPALSGTEAARLASDLRLDYAAIGFRCGLEIHQQLDTRKLFSPCPSEVVDLADIPGRTLGRLDRRLRVTQSELGELDPAALAESRRDRSFRYLVLRGVTSLVETDEEPPHPMSEEALEVALQFAGLVAARPAAEVHVMRKTVIDGSNTSGFQRTALIATGGRVEVEGGEVGLWTLALEEDSARKLDDGVRAASLPAGAGPALRGVVTYTLDRLGIPLLEVSTAPDIKDPAHAQRTAARIGALLRATGRVKRGLGTIRQDLNVSVGVGERVEVKGCQDLRAIPRIIENECRRQLWLHHVAEELKRRGFTPEDVGAPQDATSAFASSHAKAVAEAVREGHKVLGLRLRRMAGLLKGATKEGPRLGRELADHAKVFAGVKGIFHSDELPAYGITEGEVAAARKALGCAEADAFALCVESESVARKALAAVAERAHTALAGATREVRGVQPDDSTRFLRPMPGAARMYPETDVPPIRITAERWKGVLSHLPPKPEERVAALVRQGLGLELAKQVVAEGVEGDCEELVRGGTEPTLAARILLQVVPSLQNGAQLASRLPELFGALRQGRFAKEALEPILKRLDSDPGLPLEAAVAQAGGGMADAAAVDAVCRRVVQERLAFVREKGAAAVGPLMGPVMTELRGKADGQLISARLKAAIKKALE